MMKWSKKEIFSPLPPCYTLNKHTCTQQVRNESGTWKKKLSSETEKEKLLFLYFYYFICFWKKPNASIAEFSFLVDDEQHIHFSYPVQRRRHLNWIHEKQSGLYKGPFFFLCCCFLSLAIFFYLLLHNSWRSRLWTSAANCRISKFGKNTKERRQQKQKLFYLSIFQGHGWVCCSLYYLIILKSKVFLSKEIAANGNAVKLQGRFDEATLKSMSIS